MAFEVTDKMVADVRDQFENMVRANYNSEFRDATAKSIINLVLGWIPDWPQSVPPEPHHSLNERVARLEQDYKLLREEVVDIGEHADVIASTLNHNAEVSQELDRDVAALEEKIDTHIHHVDHVYATSTAIYPVGDTPAAPPQDDPRLAPITVSDEDVWFVGSTLLPHSSLDITKSALQSFADRVNTERGYTEVAK